MDKKRSAKEIIELTDKYVASTYNRSKIAIVKGKKSSVWDADGKRYLDFTSGIAVTNLGHSNPILSKFIQKNIIRLTHVSNYFYNEGQGVMAELLVNHIGKGRVFFCNSGAEAVEGALKASRLYASNQSTKQTEFIAFEGSFHGRTFGALSVTGQKKYHKGFTPLLSGVKFAKYGDIKDVASKINAKTAAVIVEPIQCESGVRIPPANFLEKLSVLCKQKNVLLIMDEVQTGCSRTGKFLAYEHTKAKPSIVTMAKGIANGFPMGAVWLSADVAKKSLTAGS
ncbi:MAG: aspartate aminotransferase family protein, partial [Nitrospinota bacterium]